MERIADNRYRLKETSRVESIMENMEEPGPHSLPLPILLKEQNGEGREGQVNR
jgi:hypothetical protein